MSSYMHGSRLLERKIFGRPMKTANDEVKADDPMTVSAVGTSENRRARSAELTLDDFGGRSDALGG